MSKRIVGCITLFLLLACGTAFAQAPAQRDQVMSRLGSRNPDQIQQAVEEIRTGLQSDPGKTVDQLNNSWMTALLGARQYDAVEEFATAGTLALPADTWRIEQLQKHRIAALLAQGKNEEALHAARALFNVCGMGFVKEALPLVADALKATHPNDPGIVPKFRLQVLANAQEDPAERKKLLDRYGGNSVMDSISAEPGLYAEAIAKRKGMEQYRELYGTGNLLLMSGRVKEAHEVFLKVYKIAPPGELKYASEGIAKLIKAEDGGVGRANQFVMSIRPR
jgi:tetratricopeptide (TPR) repeat protein